MTRRRVALAVAAVAVTGGTVAAGLPAGAADGPVRVDVVFDDARGLIPGQDVMIAGALVGTITDVSVTPDDKARLHLEVDRRFAPFRADARCTIKPQGLIAENYVDCHPGTATAPPLEARDGRPPTVPVTQTTQPVALTDLFEVWSTPTRQRLSVLLSTLGIATAGRGEDLNAILRRANPSLTLARRTIARLREQRAALAGALDDLGPVTAALAERPERLSRFLRRTREVAEETAAQRAALGSGVRRLPGLLGAARPALRRLDAVLAAGGPLLEELEHSAPDLARLGTDLPALARAAPPALRALDPVLRDGARVAKQTRPLARRLRRYAGASLPSARQAGEALPLLEERGFLRNLLVFTHNTALATARFDADGHLLPAHVGLGLCAQHATTPSPGCRGTAQARKRVARRRPPKRTPAPGVPVTPSAPAPARPQATATAPARPVLPTLPGVPPLEELPQAHDAVEGLLDYLLR